MQRAVPPPPTAMSNALASAPMAPIGVAPGAITHAPMFGAPANARAFALPAGARAFASAPGAITHAPIGRLPMAMAPMGTMAVVHPPHGASANAFGMTHAVFGSGAPPGAFAGAPPGAFAGAPPGAFGGRPRPGQFLGMAITHPSGLSPELLVMFAPRPPLRWAPPPLKMRKTQPLRGVAAVAQAAFETTEKARGDDDDDDGVDDGNARRKPSGVFERVSKEERLRAKLKAREDKSRALVAAALKDWNPKSDPNATTDPYRTLFVGRLAYDVTEDVLRREFEHYGAVSSVSVVRDKENDKPRGYAFVEFEREGDMKAAYRGMDGRRVEDRRIVVDVERGRTLDDWRPRRLGGGLGRTRAGGKHDCSNVSGRDRGGDDRRNEDRRQSEREERDRPRSRDAPRRSPPPRARSPPPRARSPPRAPPRAPPPPPRSSSSEEEGEVGEIAPPPPPTERKRDRRERSPSPRRSRDDYDRDRSYRSRSRSRSRSRDRDRDRKRHRSRSRSRSRY